MQLQNVVPAIGAPSSHWHCTFVVLNRHPISATRIALLHAVARLPPDPVPVKMLLCWAYLFIGDDRCASCAEAALPSIDARTNATVVTLKLWFFTLFSFTTAKQSKTIWNLASGTPRSAQSVATREGTTPRAEQM